MIASLLLLASGARAVGVAPGQIKNFVTFGDSYTYVVNVGDGVTAWPVSTSMQHCNLSQSSLSGLCRGVCGRISIPFREKWRNLFKQYNFPSIPAGIRKPAAGLLCGDSQWLTEAQS